MNKLENKNRQNRVSLSPQIFNGFADCSAKPFLYYVYVQSLRQAQ